MEIIKFEKEGCAPCQVVDAWLKAQGVTEVTKYNPFEDIEQGIEYNITIVPTLILLGKDGVEVKRCIGGIEKNPKRYEALLELYKGGKNGSND